MKNNHQLLTLFGFLADRGALEGYINNLLKKLKTKRNSSNKPFFKVKEIEHMCANIGASFIWADSLEGHEYWSQLNNEYAELKRKDIALQFSNSRKSS